MPFVAVWDFCRFAVWNFGRFVVLSFVPPKAAPKFLGA
jgi:hypothetical protein